MNDFSEFTSTNQVPPEPPPDLAHSASLRPARPAWEPGRVFRCAWCHDAAPIPGGLPFYTYQADGEPVAVTPSAHDDFSGSDGICRAHRAALLASAKRDCSAA